MEVAPKNRPVCPANPPRLPRFELLSVCREAGDLFVVALHDEANGETLDVLARYSADADTLTLAGADAARDAHDPARLYIERNADARFEAHRRLQNRGAEWLVL